mmetsp:Transcript_38304/g.108306  ORF Transcript_38304/g.108306 Transcript_38304/m.108306 type:complete len:267 (-) Transcript_38304:103-903(-)
MGGEEAATASAGGPAAAATPQQSGAPPGPAAAPVAAVKVEDTIPPGGIAATARAVLEVPDAPPVKPEDAPAVVLAALLNKLSQLDTTNFFQAAVTEAVAPGYFGIIKRPMCFQRMREKLAGREYRTWRSFCEDFELICNNATTYNQKRSRIFRAATTMLKAGRKLLQAGELEGRKAITLLHPDGPLAAAQEDEAEVAAAVSASVGSGAAQAAAAAKAEHALHSSEKSPPSPHSDILPLSSVASVAAASFLIHPRHPVWLLICLFRV